MSSEGNTPRRVKVVHSPEQMQAVVNTMSTGGYSNVEEANAALDLMFSHSGDLMSTIEMLEKRDRPEGVKRREEALRTLSDQRAQLAITLQGLISLILIPGDDANPVTAADLRAAAEHANAVSETVGLPVGTNAINIFTAAANLRAMAKDQCLRSVGRAARERLVNSAKLAADVLLLARSQIESAQERAHELAREMHKLRQAIETVAQPNAAALAETEAHPS